MTLNEHFITEQSETSDNRPYKSSTILPETFFEHDNPETIQHNLNGEFDQFQDQEDTPQEEKHEYALQEQPTFQHDPRTHEQQNTILFQNLSDRSDITTNIQPSLIITTGSNLIDIPVRQITEPQHNNQNQDDIFTISTSNTNTKQPFQTQQSSISNKYSNKTTT